MEIIYILIHRVCFFFNDTATTEIYTYLHTLSLHDALPISLAHHRFGGVARVLIARCSHFLPFRIGVANAILLHERPDGERLAAFDIIGMGLRQPLIIRLDFGRSHRRGGLRSEEHTSELQSLMRISYAVFCLKKKKININ